jgi:hypothetical protein
VNKSLRLFLPILFLVTLGVFFALQSSRVSAPARAPFSPVAASPSSPEAASDSRANATSDSLPAAIPQIADSVTASSSASPTLAGAAISPVSPAAALVAESPAELPSNNAGSSAPTTADELSARYADAKTPADLLRDADLSNPVVRAFVVARMSEMQEAQH